MELFFPYFLAQKKLKVIVVFFFKIRKGNTSICLNSYNKLHSDLFHMKKKLSQITKALQFLRRREHSFSDSKRIFLILHLSLRKCAYVIKTFNFWSISLRVILMENKSKPRKDNLSETTSFSVLWLLKTILS